MMKAVHYILRSALLAVVWICGCGQPESYIAPIPPEKTHTIETLPLADYESEIQPTASSILEMPEQPPATIDLTLEQCRALAMENNLDLKVQLIAPNISQESVNAERAKFEAA
ncbi:MAG: hypothetical protein ACYSOK_03710, partial [Planctomycetota bacterium]